MSFPVFIPLGPWRLHPHVFFEALAYAVGFAICLWMRRREGDPIEMPMRWSIIAAALVGAAIGSRVLAWVEFPAMIPDHWRDPQFLFGSKTVVGGLIGGVIGVEWTKARLGIKTATGDLFAIPLVAGIAIGRIGCLLTGLADGTYGNPTTLWTGIDFGDGIPRHPTQLYESAFMVILLAVLVVMRKHHLRQGDLFRVFMVGYLSFRLAIDAIKPEPAVLAGLSSIQWACVAVLAYYVAGVLRAKRFYIALEPE